MTKETKNSPGMGIMAGGGVLFGRRIRSCRLKMFVLLQFSG